VKSDFSLYWACVAVRVANMATTRAIFLIMYLGFMVTC
jgi:hypothetical protein